MQTPKPLGFEINLDRFKKSNPFVWAKGMEGYNRITTEDNPHFKELRHRKDLQPFLTEPYVDAESIGWLQAAKAMQELTTEIHTLDLYDVSKKSDCLLLGPEGVTDISAGVIAANEAKERAVKEAAGKKAAAQDVKKPTSKKH